jgi:hypothetical protein
MNAQELLQHLEDGATLKSRWRYGKRVNTLRLSNGETMTVQYSNIYSLLKHHKLASILYSGDNYDYYLVKPNVSLASILHPAP